MRIRDRRVGLGASEVPAIAGISPYTTPVELWLRKTGGPEQPDNGAMQVGRQLEVPLLRLVAAQRDLVLRHNTVTRTHPRWPDVPLYATPDAFGPGGSYLGEIKVVGAWNSNDWAAGVPDYIRLQVQAQMAVHPAARYTVVGALINGTDLRIECIDRDDAVIAELEEQATAWWCDYVVTGTPPDPTCEEDRWALLRSMVPTLGRPIRVAEPHEQATVEAFAELDKSAKRLRGDADVLRRQMAEAARDIDIRGPGWTAKWHDRQGTPSFALRVQDREEISV